MFFYSCLKDLRDVLHYFAENASDPLARLIVTTLSSIGWRMTSSTRVPNSGNSSKNKTPCEREIFHLAWEYSRRRLNRHEKLYDAAPGRDDAGSMASPPEVGQLQNRCG